MLREVPRTTFVVFLLAVFFILGNLGLAGDVIDMGRQSPLRFAVSTVLVGLFSVSYAAAGITLRGKFWKACIPIFVVQFGTMALVGKWLPDPPQTGETAVQPARLQSRLSFDGVSIMIAVCIGYTGFIYVSISEARRYGRLQAEKASLDTEMAAARQVQQVILPEPGASFPGYKVDSVYKPAQQVGGDFFQILPAGDGGLLLVVGDVAGKGLPAAMLVSMLVGVIRATAETTHDPAVLLGKLHDRLAGHTAGGFSTALAAHIAADGAVTIANAGHLSPYLDGREVELPGALPLGVDGAGQYENSIFTLRSGSRLAFFSDGVVEARSPSGELFGFDRSQAISTHSAAAIADDAVRFGQSDDITVVTVERTA